MTEQSKPPELSMLVKQLIRWVVQFDENATHAMRTMYWLRRLDPEPSEAIQIACLLHDIESSFAIGRIPPTTDGQNDYMDSKYLRWHAYRSAKFAGELLDEREAENGLISKVRHLIENHEHGGDVESNLVKDADCISFLEVHAMLFCDWIPSELSCRTAHEKIESIYQKISDSYAQTLAKPYYEKAVEQLYCDVSEDKN